MLKFELPKQFDAKHNKVKLFFLCYESFEVWWLRPWCASTRFWVQSLMDACINISYINVVHKHVYIVANGVKIIF